MYEQVEKPKESNSRAVANSVAQKKSNGTQDFGFVDNRPEAIAQRKLQKLDKPSQYLHSCNTLQCEINTENTEQILLSFVVILEQLESGANVMEVEGDKVPELSMLSERIAKLRNIASGSDELLKSSTLQALKAEIPDGQISTIKAIENEDPEEVSQQMPYSTIQRLTGVEVGFIVAGAVLGIGLIAGGIAAYLTRRRQRAIFNEFGNRNRNSNFNPDVVGPGGIHQIAPAAARPEDPPAVNVFRVNFHKLHSAKLYLEQEHPTLVAGFTANQAGLLNNLSVKDRLIEISGAVKDESKEHKKRVKDVATDTSIATLNQQYTAAITQLGVTALNLANVIRDYVIANSTDTNSLDQIHTAGTDIWRATWLSAIQAVNTVLHGRWPHWRGQITNFIIDKRDNEHRHFMDPDQPLDLDYIGSLAKGYKGPPKQAVRFMPEKFDVDANLTAAPLAAYAISVGGATVDRDRVWSQYAGAAVFNGLLQPMQNDIQNRLVAAGLIQMGMDPNEPFEVVIDTAGIQHLPAAPPTAIASKALSTRDLTIRDKLHSLRTTDRARFQRVGTALNVAGHTQVNLAGQYLLLANDEANQIYAFTDHQLTAIDDIIDTTL